MRTFEHAPAIRQRVWLRLGLAGPTGSGKSLSSQNLAYGFAQVDPGPVWLINTEGPNGLLYAPKPGQNPAPPMTFPFEHLPLDPPHRTPDYLAAILFAVKNGARHIIIDGGHFEHESYLRFHDDEIDRLAGKNATYERRKQMAFTAWIKPSAERHNALLEMRLIPANIIWCFQGKEKLKIKKKGAAPAQGQPPGQESEEKMVEMGWQPIAGQEVTAELPIRFILPAGADGVPTLRPELPGEKLFNRVPIELRQAGFLVPGKPIDIELGKRLQEWALPGPVVWTAVDGKAVAMKAEPATPAASPGSAPAQDSQSAREGERTVEAATLRKEILATLEAAFPWKEGKKQEGLEAMELAFATRVWADVAKLPAAQLRIGLDALKRNLEGVAAMREREPGEEDE